MPIYNVTIKDTSPMIQYSRNWAMDQRDPFRNRYAGSTFHATNTPGSLATLSFYGSAVTIFGAKRGNHGAYTVSLDGFLSFQGNGRIPDPGVFQTPLYTSPRLRLDNHVVTIRHEGGINDFVDIDYVEVQTGDMIPDLKLSREVDDGALAVTYLPDAAWPRPSSDAILTQFFNQTNHVTTVAEAQAVVNFTGNAVAIFGSTGPSPEYGSYTVQVDSRPPLNFTRNAFLVTQQVLLFQTANLSSGAHSVVLTNKESGRKMDIDFFEVTTFSTRIEGNPFENRSKTPIIAGSVAAAGLIIILLFVGFFFWWRRRREIKRRDAIRGSLEIGSDKAIVVPVVSPYPSTVTNGHSHQPSMSSSYPQSNYQPSTVLPYATPYPSSGAPSKGSSAYAGVNRRDDRSYFASTGQSVHSVNPRSEASSGDRHDQPRTHAATSTAKSMSPKSQSFSDSTGSHPNLAYQSQEVANGRMVVPNRPQDWGPVRVEYALPPDYVQATEPMHGAPAQRP